MSKQHDQKIGCFSNPSSATIMTDSKTSEKYIRHIRSFVKREGKLTSGQSNAIEQLWPTHGVNFEPELLNLSELFGRKAETILELSLIHI